MVFTFVVHFHANDDPATVPTIQAKLVEASQTFLKDEGTLSFFVMQGQKDPRDFTIVERFENTEALTIHENNPYYKTFREFFMPLLDRPMDFHSLEELDTSKEVPVPQ